IDNETRRPRKKWRLFGFGVRFFRSMIGNLRMLGCETSLFLVETLGPRDGKLERFPNGHLLIFVLVRRVALEGFQEVIVKDDVVVFLTASRGRNHHTVLTR